MRIVPESVSHDLESFAKYDGRRVSLDSLDTDLVRHAGRKTIAVDDVMLLTRRNEGLETVLRTFVDKQQIGKRVATVKK